MKRSKHSLARKSLALNLELYQGLYLIRKAEEGIIDNYGEDAMKTPMHMSMGQEAISVGVCQALSRNDLVFGTYRSHALFLAKTREIDFFFAELYGKTTGTAAGKAGSMHLAYPGKGHMNSSAIVASLIPVAAGAAFAAKQKKKGQIVATFFGDGALEEGVFWETINVSNLMHLPLLFICEDNGFAVHTPRNKRQSFKKITKLAQQFGCSVFSGNGSDVQEAYDLASKAVKVIRSKQKPAFLHFTCYRYLEHVGINEDFEMGYRPIQEYEQWFKKDCLTTQRKQLMKQGLSEKILQKKERALDQLILKAIEKAKKAPLPSAKELYRGVFYEKN